MPGRKWILLTFALVLFAGATGAQLTKQSLMGFNTPKKTDLDIMRTHPEAFKAVWVTFEIQYGGLSRVYNPFFTKFVPADYICFSAWAGKQELWKLDEFRRDFHFLFIDKRSSTTLRLFNLKKFQRCQVVGYVRNTFQGTPWIEVTSLEPIGESLKQETLFHFIRGRSLMKKGQWSLAGAELSTAAKETSMPGFARGQLYHDLSYCLIKQGKFAAGRDALAKAKAALPHSIQVKRLAAMIKKNPVQVMDQRVQLAGLKPWEKPLWRAQKKDGQGTRGIGPIRGNRTRKVTTPPGARKASPPKN